VRLASTIRTGPLLQTTSCAIGTGSSSWLVFFDFALTALILRNSRNDTARILIPAKHVTDITTTNATIGKKLTKRNRVRGVDVSKQNKVRQT
jgi:hypothetical protein